MPYVEDEERRTAILRAGLGRGFPFWHGAIRLQQERLALLLRDVEGLTEDDIVRGEVLEPNRFRPWRSQALADSHFLLVAVRHVLRHARRLKQLVEPTEQRPAQAFARFVAGDHKRAEAVRDALEHWDDYNVGGQEDVRKGLAKEPGDLSIPVRLGPVEGDLLLAVGVNEFRLIELADAACEMAVVLDEVWLDSITQPDS